MSPEHGRLRRYETMSLDEIASLPVQDIADTPCHLYLWCPNALLPWGLQVLEQWGFRYKSNVVWYKVRKDGGPDGRGVGFYFRNVTELLLFGVRGSLRTLDAGRRQVNLVHSQKREHSRKPDEIYNIIESCSPGPYLELFARERRPGWVQWGNELGKAIPNYYRNGKKADLPPEPKRPRGRPPTRIIELDATPEQVAQAIFKSASKS